MQDTVSYTEPILCTYGDDISKPWFVYFDVTNRITRQTLRKQFRGGINYATTIEKRLKYGIAYSKYWSKKLRNGWDPFDNGGSAKVSKMSLSEALDFALGECEVARKTKKGYECTVRFMKKAINRMGYSRLPIVQTKRIHLRLLLKNCIQKNNWTNKAYNKHLGYLRAVLGRLIHTDIIENNPASKIITKRVAETQKFLPYTEQEKKVIREYLFIHHYRFFIILDLLYQTGIRPKEILALRVMDVNMENELIVIKPDLDMENSKTRKIRTVPINKHLLPFFREMELYKHPLDYFVFGSPFESGKGNKGSVGGGGILHPDYFKPSAVMVKRDTVTKFWKKIVIDKLGIKKHFYAAKHSGANDKILAGISLDALQEIYGHTSKMMTIKYATAIKQIYRKELLDKSPPF